MPRESLWKKVPDYRVDANPSGKRVRVLLAGEVIADSTRALQVEETRHAPLLYFPRDDVHFEHLTRTDHETFCPFKGEESYWSLEVGGRCEENVIWSYESPFPEVELLKDYMAFYPDRVVWEFA